MSLPFMRPGKEMMSSTSGPGQQTTTSAIPRLLTRPLAKVSHATVDQRDPVSPPWSHLKERDDLFIVLDHVNTLQGSLGRYVEQKVLRLVCGAELVACINLDERLNHPSMGPFRRYGAQISLDQLPLGILVRPPNLRITYNIENGQRRILQLKFITEAACQEVATSLEAIGLPVRAGILLDRPSSQRLSTAGTWSLSPPASQPINAWSPTGSSSSQTVQTLESSAAADQLARESQARRARRIPEPSRLATTVMSPPMPNPLTQSLEYPAGFPGTHQTRNQPPSTRQVGPQGTPVVQSYQQSQKPCLPQTAQDFRYYPMRLPTGSTERVAPISPSTDSQRLNSLPYGSTNYMNGDIRGASLMQTPSARTMLATNSTLPIRRESGSGVSQLRSAAEMRPATSSSSPIRRDPDSILGQIRSPELQIPLSTPSQLYRRPATALTQNIMRPPPIPERAAPSRAGKAGGKRKATEPPRPPSRRSERIATRQGIQASERDFTQGRHDIHSSPLGNNSDLPPVRELPFSALKAESKLLASTRALAEEAPASEEIASTLPMESEVASGSKGAAKKTRKAPSKSVKGTTSQPKRRAPKKPKAVGSTTNENAGQDSAGPVENSTLPLANVDAVQQPPLPATDIGHSILTDNLESNGQGPTGNPEANGSLALRTHEREVSTRPSISSEDIENMIERKLKETLGPYVSGVGSRMKRIDVNFQGICANLQLMGSSFRDIGASFREISEMTDQLAASS